MVWAVIGSFFLIAEVWVMARWAINGGGWSPTYSNVSTTWKVLLWAVMLITIATIVFYLTWTVIQVTKRRTLTIEAMLLFGYSTTFWLIPVINYTGENMIQNRYLISTTSWGPYMPGWRGPNSEPQQLFSSWFGLCSAMVYFVPTLWLLRVVVLRRWPHLTGPKLVLAAVVVSIVLNLVLEPLMILGSYSFVKAVPWLTLFAGHWYQFPVYELITTGIAYGAVPGLMCYYHQHHPRGAPILRGVEQFPRAARPWIATLSATGLAQVIILFWTASNAVIALAGVPLTGIPARLR